MKSISLPYAVLSPPPSPQPPSVPDQNLESLLKEQVCCLQYCVQSFSNLYLTIFQGCYETPEGLAHRHEVLKSLNILVQQWIQVPTNTISNMSESGTDPVTFCSLSASGAGCRGPRRRTSRGGSRRTAASSSGSRPRAPTSTPSASPRSTLQG